MSLVLKPYPGESQASFLKRFNSKVKSEKIVEQIREKTAYKKKSQIRQEERKEKRNKIHKYLRDIDKV